MVVILMAIACKSERSTDTSVAAVAMVPSRTDQPDMVPVVTYATLERDTARKVQLIPVENETYPLHIISYSLNDSSVINRYHDGSTSIDHDRAFLLLLEGYGSDRSIVLDRTTFRDSLYADFFQRSRLYLVDFTTVRSNALYFDAFIGVPETDNVQEFEVQWFFRGPRVGTVRFIGKEGSDDL